MTRFLVSVRTVSPVKALAALMARQVALDTCKVGWGWSERVDGVGCFCRRTKTGYSITETERTS